VLLPALLARNYGCVPEGDELLPDEPDEPDEPELPLGELAPPVDEPEPRPKKDRTLCLQLGCDKSVLASKLGADCSLLVSPVKTNVCWPSDEPVVVLLLLVPLLLLPDSLDERSKVQGTATCLPMPLELVLLLVDELELEPGELELLEPELLKERTAKSMRPELGLTITSLIVPSVSPELP